MRGSDSPGLRPHCEHHFATPFRSPPQPQLIKIDAQTLHHVRTPLRTPTHIRIRSKTDEKTAPDAPLFHHFRTPLRAPTHIRIRSKTYQKTAPDAPLPPHPDDMNMNITGPVSPWDAGPLPHTQTPSSPYGNSRDAPVVLAGTAADAGAAGWGSGAAAARRARLGAAGELEAVQHGAVEAAGPI